MAAYKSEKNDPGGF